MQSRSLGYFAVVVLVAVAIIGGTLYFVQKKSSPLIGSWEIYGTFSKTGEFNQKLTMEFAPDGTGKTSVVSTGHEDHAAFTWSVSGTTLYVYDADRIGTGEKKYNWSLSNDGKTLYLHPDNPMASDTTLILSAAH